MESERLSDLRSRLSNLANLLNPAHGEPESREKAPIRDMAPLTADRAASSPARASPQKPFKTAMRGAPQLSRSNGASFSTGGCLPSLLRDAEAGWAKEKGALRLDLQARSSLMCCLRLHHQVVPPSCLLP